jgi:hypothetical protein
MVTKAKKLKLFDAAMHAASCLKEAGEPLHGLGPSQQYADAFNRYSLALKALVAGTCALHVGEWSWDGYEGNFRFRWEFGAQLAQPHAAYDHDTRFVETVCPAVLDPNQPLESELDRLAAEAEHYEGLRGEMLRWASKKRQQVLTKARLLASFNRGASS